MSETHIRAGVSAVVRAGELWRVRFIVEGSPGQGSLNAKHKIAYLGKRCPRCKRGQPKIVPSDEAKTWKDRATLLARSAAAICPPEGRMMPHAVAASITLYWPQLHRKNPHLENLPYGDVDACEKLTLDALKAAGVLYDDGQVCELHIRKRHDAQNPRVAVSVQRID